MPSSAPVDVAMARLRPLLVELDPDQFLWAERSYREVVLSYELAPATDAADDIGDFVTRRAVDRLCAGLESVRPVDRWRIVLCHHYDARVAVLSQRALVAARAAPASAHGEIERLRDELAALGAEIRDQGSELIDRYEAELSEALLDCEFALDPSIDVLSLRHGREAGPAS